jgi:hypothetical protein
MHFLRKEYNKLVQIERMERRRHARICLWKLYLGFWCYGIVTVIIKQ